MAAEGEGPISAFRMRTNKNDIIRWLVRSNPEGVEALDHARRNVAWCKREVYTYQALLIHTLIRVLNPGSILEIGTARGYTSAVMAEATDALITTLNPNLEEVEAAKEQLKSYSNVDVIAEKSWDYLGVSNETFDFIFIDGDHARVRRDLPWWNRLEDGGLFLFHDYSPHGSGRPTPTVYAVVNNFSEWLGREPQVLVVDEYEVGMAGFIRRPNDKDY